MSRAASSRPDWSTRTTTSTNGSPAVWRWTGRCSSGSRRCTRCGPTSTRTSPVRRRLLPWTGCTTSTDHHYVFPHHGGDLLGAEIEAARTVGLRFRPARGSMDLGQSDGGLPPDEVVEDLDSILTASEKAIQAHHDASFDSMLRIARPMLALLRDR